MAPLKKLSDGAAAGAGGPRGRSGMSLMPQTQPDAPAPPRLRAVPHRCKSRFCKNCCLHLGLSIRARMAAVFSTFRCVYMVTLTTRQDLFDGPRAAFDYVREKRGPALLVQALKRGYWITDENGKRHKEKPLHSTRWACVLEWQKNGWAHWHLVLDASFIDFYSLARLWAQVCWDESAFGGVCPPTGKGLSPAFGHVRFSKRLEDEPAHAANYVAKYLTKIPAEGWPDWVLDHRLENGSGGRIRRFSTSRGFWGESGADDYEETDEERLEKTIRERLDTCGAQTVIAREDPDFVNEETGQVGRLVFVCRIPVPFDEFISDPRNGVREDGEIGGEILGKYAG